MDADPLNLPITSTADTAGFDAMAAAGLKLGEDLKRLQDEESKASAPVAPPVSAPGAPQATKALQEVGNAGEQVGQKVKKGAEEAKGFLDGLEHSAGGLTKLFAGGAAFALGEGALHEIEHLKEELEELLREGVQVNKEFETLGVGLASSLRQADPGRFSDFNAALVASGQLIDTIKAKALELNLDAEELGHNVQVNMLSLVEGGITSLNAQVETTGLLMQAAAAKGVTGFQAVRDVIDILNGKAERVILSRELGITNEDISRAKAAGDLAGYLTDKLGAYREAAAATRETLAGLQQQEATLGKQLLATLSAGTFEQTKEAARNTVAILQDPTTVQVTRQVADAVEAIGKPWPAILAAAQELGRDLAGFATIPFAPAAQLERATEAQEKLGLNFEQTRKALQDQVQLADSFAGKLAAAKAISTAAATAEEQAATFRSRGDVATAALLEQQAALYNRMLATLDTTAGRVVRIAGTEESRKKTLEAQQALLEQQLSTVEKIDKTLATRAEVDLKTLSPEELKSKLNAQLLNAKDLLEQGGLQLPVDFDLTDPQKITALRDQLQKPLPADANATGAQKKAAEDAINAYQALRVKLSETALSISDVQRALVDAEKKSAEQADKAGKDGDKMIADRRKFIGALADEGVARDELKKRQDELKAAQSAADKDSEDGQKRIKAAIKEVEQAQKDLQKAEQDRQDAQKKAFPEELARIRALEAELKQLGATGEFSQQKEDDLTELNNLRRKVNGAPPATPPGLSTDSQKRILGDVDANGQPTSGPADPDAPTPSNLPADFGQGGYGGYGGSAGNAPPASGDSYADTLGKSAESTAAAADNTKQTADAQATAAGDLQQQTAAVQTGFGNVSQGQAAHAQAVNDGLGSLVELYSSTLDTVRGILSQVGDLKTGLAQVQLQAQNMADSGDDAG